MFKKLYAKRHCRNSMLFILCKNEKKRLQIVTVMQGKLSCCVAKITYFLTFLLLYNKMAVLSDFKEKKVSVRRKRASKNFKCKRS